MRPFDAVRARLYALLHRSRMDKEIEEELRLHLQNLADHLERSGLTRAEAERQARIQFGGLELYREESHAAQGWHTTEMLVRDVRFGLRILRKSPHIYCHSGDHYWHWESGRIELCSPWCEEFFFVRRVRDP